MRPLIIIDKHIPYIQGVLEKFGEVVYASGKSISANMVTNASSLFVRTRTKCNEQLLKDSDVKFIATATIGFDHIDADYCHKHGIYWTNAPGCNSGSVAQYILSSLVYYAKKKNIKLENQTIGIIGVGNVGMKVEKIAETLGMRVLLNDPPRAEKEGTQAFTSLEEIAKEADIITIHTPLNYDGKYPTYHLLNDNFFKSLKRSPLFINTARGEAVDSEALKKAYRTAKISDMIVDCWENEPFPDPFILEKALFATPHIAGYSADGKSNGTQMCVDAFLSHWGLSNEPIKITPPKPKVEKFDFFSFEDAVLRTYHPGNDSEQLKQAPESFESLRENYPLRREALAYSITKVPEHEKLRLERIGFNLV